MSLPHPSSLVRQPSPPDSRPAAGDLFRTDHLHDDLKGRSVRGGAAALAGQAANFLLKLGSTAVLARLLTPADFGLIAMVTAVTGFVEMFKDAGLSTATVQRAEINHRQISTLFWLNVALSVLLMLVVVALAPAVAWFYGEPQLLGVTIALGAMFPLGGLTIQHNALLRRQMRFGTLAAIDVVSNFVGIAAGIAAAAFGARYWALVAMMAVSEVAGAALVWLSCPWLPGFPRRGTGVRSMLGFGLHVSLANVLAYVQRSADNVLIGVACGAQPLGFYTRAYQLLVFPLRQISYPVNAVAIPVFCRLRDSVESFRVSCRSAVLWVASLGMPMVAFAFVDADDLVRIVLGPGWAEAALLFRLLAPAAFFSVVYAESWVCLSEGRADRLTHIALARTAMLVPAFAIAVGWGASAVAAVFGILDPVLRVLSWMYAFRGSPIRVRDILAALWRPFVLSIASSFLLVLLRDLTFVPESVVLRLGFDGLCFAVIYCTLWVLLPGGRERAREAICLARHLLPGRAT